MDTVILLVVVIVVFFGIWQWLKKEFPAAMDVTVTLMKGAVEGSAWAIRKGIDLHGDAQRTVQCPQCRTVITIYGVCECEHCHGHATRNVFAPCSRCGRTGRGFITCHNCHATVRPWWIRKRGNEGPHTRH